MSSVIILNQKHDEVLNTRMDSIPRVGEWIAIKTKDSITRYRVDEVEYQFDTVLSEKCVCITAMEFSKRALQ